jgi:predicted nucleic acid-binding protein
MVDSDVMIRFLRGFSDAQAWFLHHHADIVLPGYVAIELINGCHNKREMALLQNLLESLKIVWLKPAQAVIALEVFESVHLKNKIGILDVLIGQTAVQESLTLYTFNHKHYKVIPNITVAKPY